MNIESPQAAYLGERVGAARRIISELGFGRAPRPGESLPDFDLQTTEGRRVRRGRFLGHSPVLLYFCSASCPMSAAALPGLRRLHERFGTQLEIVGVYVREAHPGELRPQPRSFDEKLTAACAFRQRHRLPWTVAVDSLDGSFHRALGGHPGAAFLVDRDGRVAFRALWAAHESALRRALRAFFAGAETPIGEDRARLVPMTAGLGCLSETLAECGPAAERELLRGAAPLYGLGRLAGAFGPLSPFGRGLAALALVGAATAGALWAAGRRRRGEATSWARSRR